MRPQSIPGRAGIVKPILIAIVLPAAVLSLQPGCAEKPPGAKTTKAVEWLKDKLDSFDLTVSLSPDDPGRVFALRSLDLRVTLVPAEPHGLWPDGKPISAGALVSREQAAKLIDSLAKAGFFEIAGKYHSERLRGEATGQKPPPPADSRPYGPPDRKDAHCSVHITASDGHWVAYFLASLDWNAGMLKYLDAIRAPLDGDAAKTMDQLLEPLGPQRKLWGRGGATRP